MKGKLLLLATAITVAVLALGSVIAWAAADRGGGSQPQPVWTHSQSDRMDQMHRSLDKGDLDRMVEACTEAMDDGHMMDADDLDGHDVDDMMGGGMMGGGMMGGGVR